MSVTQDRLFYRRSVYPVSNRAEELEYGLEELKDQICLVNVEPGEVVYHQGMPKSSIFILYEGSVKWDYLTLTGKRFTSHVIRPVSLVDYSAYGYDDTCLVSARAIERSLVGVMALNQYVAWLREQPDLLLAQMREVSEMVTIFHKRLTQMAYRSVRERLIMALIELSEGFSEREGIRIILQEQELAQMIGATRETTVRELSALKKRGLIEVKGQNIFIFRNALRDYQNSFDKLN